MFWKNKKRLIHSIESMLVESKIKENEAVFKIKLDKTFSPIAKEGLRPILEEFILTINKKLYPGSFWFVSAFDYIQFLNEAKETERLILRDNPCIKYVSCDNFDIILLFEEMSASVFQIIKNTKLPDGNTLGMDVLDARLVAFRTNDIEGVLKKASQKNISTDDVYNIFEKEQRIVDVFYFDSIGAKIHEITITSDISSKNVVRECLSEVFSSHGITLVFS